MKTLLTVNRERWALSFLENLKSFWEKNYPQDKKGVSKIDELIHSICWKIQESQDDASQI